MYASCLGSLLRRLKPVFPIGPGGVPKIINSRLRFSYLFAELHQLGAQVRKNVGKASCVAARVREAFDQPHREGIADTDEHNRNCGRSAFRRHRCARTGRYQQLRPALDQVSYCLTGIAGAGPDNIEHDVTVFDQANLAQA